jgi:hypothetical protein
LESRCKRSGALSLPRERQPKEAIDRSPRAYYAWQLLTGNPEKGTAK